MKKRKMIKNLEDKFIKEDEKSKATCQDCDWVGKGMRQAREHGFTYIHTVRCGKRDLIFL